LNNLNASLHAEKSIKNLQLISYYQETRYVTNIFNCFTLYRFITYRLLASYKQNKNNLLL